MSGGRRGGGVDSWGAEPEALQFTNDYVKRLLLERHHIRARLTNQGGSIILTATARVDFDRFVDYSTEIGNSFHADLITLDQHLAELSKGERDALNSYIDGMSSEEAAPLLNARGGVTVRQRRKRALDRLTKRLNEQRQPES